MQKIILVATLLSVAYAGWVLEWSDEFDGNTLNTNKWVAEIGAGIWGNEELEYYRKENAQVNNGFLYITAKKEYYKGSDYTSARLKTQGKFSTLYGKFEMRAKLPEGQGMWPAFWLLGANIEEVGHPACGEIDIMEYIGREPDYVYGAVHSPGYDESGEHYGGSYTSDFRTYSAIWSATQVEFQVDGITYKTVPKTRSGEQWPFDKEFFILLNLAVGGTWPGNPDETTRFPQNYVIDYVRVFKHANGVSDDILS